MKKILLASLLFTALVVPAVAQDVDEDDGDRAAISQAALDYIEGYFEGNFERMARACHPELNKVIVRQLPNGREILSHMGASILVEVTRAEMGVLPPEERNIEVTILDVFDNIATVKISSAGLIDYLHIARINGEWKLVNVLWAPNR